ncbi:sulfurtransferase TusA family protein [Methylohalobius crimeensis]
MRQQFSFAQSDRTATDDQARFFMRIEENWQEVHNNKSAIILFLLYLRISQSMEFDRELDTSGLNCPLPLLRLKKTLNEMGSGQVVHVIATDPASILDFGVFADQTGHGILEQIEANGIYHYWVRKK